MLHDIHDPCSQPVSQNGLDATKVAVSEAKDAINLSLSNSLKLPFDEVAAAPAALCVQQARVALEVHTRLSEISLLPEKQKKLEEVQKFLPTIDFEIFFTDPFEWKQEKNYKHRSIVRAPNINLIAFEWEAGQWEGIHLHSDLRGGFCDAYILTIKGRANHDNYLVKGFSETGLIISPPDSKILTPGNVEVVYGGINAHAMGNLGESVLWTIHFYNGSIGRSAGKQRFHIKGS